MSTVSTTTCDKCKRYRVGSDGEWKHLSREFAYPDTSVLPASIDLCPDCEVRLLAWLNAEPVRVNL